MTILKGIFGAMCTPFQENGKGIDIPRYQSHIDDLLEGIATSDSKKLLTVVNDAIATGREPRLVGENLLSSLREAFLFSMGVPLEGLTDE